MPSFGGGTGVMGEEMGSGVGIGVEMFAERMLVAGCIGRVSAGFMVTR